MLGTTLLPGCGNQATGKNSGPPAVAAPVEQAPSRRIDVKPFCVVDRGTQKVVVFGVFDFEYTKISFGDPRSRQVYLLECWPDDKCDGQYLKLDGVDGGEPLDFLDIGTMVGAEVVSRTGSLLVVQWGPYRTFTIDLSAGKVSFAESGENVEGRGEFSCEVMR